MTKYPDPIITATAIIFDLHEPIYGSVFAIYEKWLKIAKEKKLTMVVKTPFGVSTYLTAQDWIRGAKLIKKYHNFEEPMKMYSRSVLPDIKKRTERKKIEKKIEMSSNSVMEGLARLKKNEPQMFAEIRAKLGLR